MTAMPSTAEAICENENCQRMRFVSGSICAAGFISLSIVLLMRHQSASGFGGNDSSISTASQLSKMDAKSSQTFAHSAQTVRCVRTDEDEDSSNSPSRNKLIISWHSVQFIFVSSLWVLVQINRLAGTVNRCPTNQVFDGCDMQKETRTRLLLI